MSRRWIVAALVAVALARGAEGRWVESATSEVRLGGDERAWFVQATLNGNVRGHFLLDTGASYCVLTKETARRLSSSGRGREVRLRTANGIVRAPLVRLASVQVGSKRARDIEAVVHDAVGPSADGVLGLNFLNQFQYSIDPRRRVIVLK